MPPRSSLDGDPASPTEEAGSDVLPQNEGSSRSDPVAEPPAPREPAPAPRGVRPTPRPTSARPGTPRPGLTGAILGPLPTNTRVTPAPSTTRPPRASLPPSIRHNGSAPAAPRASLGARGPLITTAPEPPGMSRGGVYLSPRMTAIFGGLFGLATVTSVIALLIQVV
ncbi:MAG: hypothetical protein ABJE95_30805, partial [Byssovorax sp.]